jgi:CubicO group peptidase (beta-lactamase class C family)
MRPRTTHSPAAAHARPRRVALIIVAVTLCVAGCTHPRAYRRAGTYETLVAQIDTYLSHLTARGAFNGYVVVFERDSTIISQGYGWADVANQVPFTGDSQFRIASVSKQFTAAAIMLGEAAGLLSVHDSAATYLPGEGLSPEITIRHLLTHTAGLDTDGGPGDAFSYSNAGYDLLSRIAAAASGRDFSEIIEDAICPRAGLSGTEVNRHRDGYVVGYLSVAPPEPAPLPDYGAGHGAGGIVSTPNDLHRWLKHLAAPPDGRPLSFQTLTAHTVAALPGVRYGYGIAVRELEVAGRRLCTYWHAGSGGGAAVEVSYAPEIDVGIVVLSNYERLDLYRTTTNLWRLIADALL